MRIVYLFKDFPFQEINYSNEIHKKKREWEFTRYISGRKSLGSHKHNRGQRD